MHTTVDHTPATEAAAARRLPPRRHLGRALLAAALVAATACGSDGTQRTAPSATTTVAVTTTVTTPTTTPATTTPTTATAGTTMATALPVVRPTEPVDELVGAPGARLHIRCSGAGDTTVLLIAGFGGGNEGWAAVEPTIATRARVCTYDKAGTGTSDPATATETFANQALDLHDLLGAAGEPGPYVVVGQSFGGATAVEFASRYAGEVTGLALIDASPTTWPGALCAIPADRSNAAILGSCANGFLPDGNSERLDVHAAFAEVAAIRTLGSLPMAVITAADRDLPELAEPEVDHLTQVWNAGQDGWVALSTESHLVSVAHSGHHIELDQPAVVIDEIVQLLP